MAIEWKVGNGRKWVESGRSTFSALAERASRFMTTVVRKSLAHLLFVFALTTGCQSPSALTAKETQSLDPTGVYLRQPDGIMTLRITRGAAGGWLVESHGNPPAGQPPNACFRVFAGALKDAELVTTSDADERDAASVRREGLAPYQGFLLDFARGALKVSGPEARDASCDLLGEYVRRQ